MVRLRKMQTEISAVLVLTWTLMRTASCTVALTVVDNFGTAKTFHGYAPWRDIDRVAWTDCLQYRVINMLTGSAINQQLLKLNQAQVPGMCVGMLKWDQGTDKTPHNIIRDWPKDLRMHCSGRHCNFLCQAWKSYSGHKCKRILAFEPLATEKLSKESSDYVVGWSRSMPTETTKAMVHEWVHFKQPKHTEADKQAHKSCQKRHQTTCHPRVMQTFVPQASSVPGECFSWWPITAYVDGLFSGLVVNCPHGLSLMNSFVSGMDAALNTGTEQPLICNVSRNLPTVQNAPNTLLKIRYPLNTTVTLDPRYTTDTQKQDLSEILTLWAAQGTSPTKNGTRVFILPSADNAERVRGGQYSVTMELMKPVPSQNSTMYYTVQAPRYDLPTQRPFMQGTCTAPKPVVPCMQDAALNANRFHLTPRTALTLTNNTVTFAYHDLLTLQSSPPSVQAAADSLQATFLKNKSQTHFSQLTSSTTVCPLQKTAASSHAGKENKVPVSYQVTFEPWKRLTVQFHYGGNYTLRVRTQAYDLDTDIYVPESAMRPS